jgi:hypothetical protein
MHWRNPACKETAQTHRHCPSQNCKNPHLPLVPQSETCTEKVMLSSNTRYAFFIGIMLLSFSRFTQVSGMWYLVAFGEIQHKFTGYPAHP